MWFTGAGSILLLGLCTRIDGIGRVGGSERRSFGGDGLLRLELNRLLVELLRELLQMYRCSSMYRGYRRYSCSILSDAKSTMIGERVKINYIT